MQTAKYCKRSFSLETKDLETKDSRPKLFETETRPETLETETKTETQENGSRDTSRDRDQVSRLHHCQLPTLNVPLQIGKVALRVHVSQFGNPYFIRG